MMIEFKGSHFERDVSLWAVWWYGEHAKYWGLMLRQG
jgi:hypothetical protein